MSALTRRRRPIFNRHRGILPIVRVAAIGFGVLVIGGVGFAAGVKVSEANSPATFAKPVMSAQIAE